MDNSISQETQRRHPTNSKNYGGGDTNDKVINISAIFKIKSVSEINFADHIFL